MKRPARSPSRLFALSPISPGKRALALLGPVAFALVLLLLIPETAPIVLAQEPPEGWVELVGKRTRTGKVFFDPSRPGVTAVDVSVAKIHYDGPDWKDIDNTLVPSLANVPTLGLVDIEMVTDDYEFYALQTLNTIPLWFYRNKSIPDSYVTFNPQALQWTNDLDNVDLISMPQSVAGVVTENRLHWEDAYGPEINLTLSAQAGRLAKALTLNVMPRAPVQYILDGENPALEVQFIFGTPSGPNAPDIRVDGILWDQSSRTETVNAVVFEKDGEMLFAFARPTVFDSGLNPVTPSFLLSKKGPNLRVAIRIPLAFLQDATYPVVIDPTVDEQVGAGADDGTSWGVNCGVPGSFSNAFGQFYAGADGTPAYYYSYLRFTTVAIPQSATIDVAYMTVEAESSVDDGTDVKADIYANDIDDAVVPTTAVEHRDLTRTTAFTAWDDVDFVVDTPTNSPSIVDVVKEVVDRGSWVSGNALMLLFDEGDCLSQTGKLYRLYSYDNDPSKAAKLHVEYAGPWTNAAPTITNKITADRGEAFVAYSRSFLATDPDTNQTLNWTLVTDATFLSVDSLNLTAFVNGTGAEVGVFYVNLTVNDTAIGGGGALTDFVNYTLQIREEGVLTDTQTMIIWLSTLLMLVLFVVALVFHLWFLWMLAGIDGILFGLFVFATLENFPLAIIIMGFGGFLLVGGVLLTIAQGVEAGMTGRRRL